MSGRKHQEKNSQNTPHQYPQIYLSEHILLHIWGKKLLLWRWINPRWGPRVGQFASRISLWDNNRIQHLKIYFSFCVILWKLKYIYNESGRINRGRIDILLKNYKYNYIVLKYFWLVRSSESGMSEDKIISNASSYFGIYCFIP